VCADQLVLCLILFHVQNKANIKTHFRYSHALDWNPKTGELRVLVLPPNLQSGKTQDSFIPDDDSDWIEQEVEEEERGLYQSLKPAKGEKLPAANRRLKITIGKTVGWVKGSLLKATKQKEQKQTAFPDCLPDLYQEALAALKKDIAAQRLRDWLIPSIAKSISLCIDVIEKDNHDCHAQLLEKLNATSSADILAKERRGRKRVGRGREGGGRTI
jgi:hypothetical protein